MSDLYQVLTVLHSMPAFSKGKEIQASHRLRKTQRLLLWVTVACLTAFYLPLVWDQWISPLTAHPTLLILAAFFWTGLSSLLIAGLIEITIDVYLIWEIIKNKAIYLIKQAQHDQAQVETLLMQFDQKTLQKTLLWLEYKADRTKSVFDTLSGSREKIAFIPLVLLAWTALLFSKNYFESGLMATVTNNLLPSMVVILGLSMLIGLFSGAFIANLEQHRTFCHIALLKLALKQQSEND